MVWYVQFFFYKIMFMGTCLLVTGQAVVQYEWPETSVSFVTACFLQMSTN